MVGSHVLAAAAKTRNVDWSSPANAREESSVVAAVILQPSRNDVIMGRGKTFRDHPGNVFYDDIVNQNRDRYFASICGIEKKGIIEGIVDHILERGCFLKRDQGRTGWVTVPKSRALLKTAHAIQYRQRRAMAEEAISYKESAMLSPFYHETLSQAPNEDIAMIRSANMLLRGQHQAPLSQMQLALSDARFAKARFNFQERYLMHLRNFHDEMSLRRHWQSQQRQLPQAQDSRSMVERGHGLWVPSLLPPEQHRSGNIGSMCAPLYGNRSEAPHPHVTLTELLRAHSGCRRAMAVSPLSVDSVLVASQNVVAAAESSSTVGIVSIEESGPAAVSSNGGNSPLIRVSSIGSFVTVDDEQLEVSISDMEW